MASQARLASYAALRAISRNELTLAQALAETRERLDDRRDRALAAEILTGSLRWRAALDHIVQHAAGRSLAKLDDEILDVLRMSVYQLVYLDRVPASAVVDDAVQITKAARKASAAGFVNGVLRAIVRLGGRLPLPVHPGPQPENDRALDYLATTLSHPRWLAERWLRRYGFAAAEAWERFNNTAAPLTLRANRLKITRDELRDRLDSQGVKTERARFAADGLSVISGNPLQTPLAGRGLFVVQDEASQLVSALAAARPGELVMDGCASPGNKTTAMVADMRNQGLVAAVDVRPARVALLSQTLRLSGAGCAHVVRADLQRGAPFGAIFDLVLVDVPCSGLGTIRRDPEIRWRRLETDLATFRTSELGILTEAAKAVRPGGRLVYSTCSSEPEENEQVVAAFLDQSPEFTLADPRDDEALPGGIVAVIAGDGALRTTPVEHGLEAFFGVRLRRDSTAKIPR
jgi:16S rRNA (cytosine967-C5)-methyltransferase